MSDRWCYSPEKCDGDFCPGDCDTCPKAEEEEKTCADCAYKSGDVWRWPCNRCGRNEHLGDYWMIRRKKA